MSNKAKKEYLKAIWERYKKATKDQKSRILDEFCQVCGYHRKYAIRVLSGPRHPVLGKRGRKAVYATDLIPHLRFLWLTMGQIAPKRLVSALPEWLRYYQSTPTGIAISAEQKQALARMSASTLNRFLRQIRFSIRTRGFSTTRSNLFLKSRIPISTLDRKITKPGYVQADTVAHCGSSTAGSFANTVTLTDIYSTWTDNRAVWTKDACRMRDAIRDIDHGLPFTLVSLSTDCGSEFLNYQVLRYLQFFRRKKVALTRSRPYKKNDNAYVEQKNFTHVRQLFGYDRIDEPRFIGQMNEIYKNYWNPLQNFFLPSMKLVAKTRVGAKITKRYDQPKTAYQRILESPDVCKERKARLRNQYKTLNPFILKEGLDEKLDQFFDALRIENIRKVA